MDFTVGKGFEIKGGVASVPADELLDHEVTGALDELKAVAEARGLWVPEGAGQIAVVQTVEVPADLRGQILANAEADIEHTNRVFEIINGTRRKKDRFDITPAGEQREKLEDQLTDRALKATAHLHITADRPPMPAPPLPGAITAEELVTAIDKSSKHGILGWAGRIAFLNRFRIDDLTGYDEQRAESGAMTLIETGYDVSRQGTSSKQLQQLETVQEEFPEVGSVPILGTASLGQRYNGQPNTWQDAYTRAIEVDPVRRDGFGCVGFAYVNGAGRSGVDGSDVRDEDVSRRQVRLEAA